MRNETYGRKSRAVVGMRECVEEQSDDGILQV